VSFFGFLIAQWIFERGLPWWGFTDRADPAALPWLLLIASIITFALSPVDSGFSRHVEHEADRFGLELTHLNEASASSMVKFAEDSKQDPNPPAFIEWWRYSHPSAQKRIDFALSYKPWESKSVRAGFSRPTRDRRPSMSKGNPPNALRVQREPGCRRCTPSFG